MGYKIVNHGTATRCIRFYKIYKIRSSRSRATKQRVYNLKHTMKRLWWGGSCNTFWGLVRDDTYVEIEFEEDVVMSGQW